MSGVRRMRSNQLPVPAESVDSCILFVRGNKVILDADLARLYGVKTKRLNEQVKRNRERFPDDFMFQLKASEKREVVANCDHLTNLKYSKGMPYAFTEHGAIMAATVLNSQQAVEVSIFVVRAFVRLREMLGSNKKLAKKLDDLERRLGDHDEKFVVVFDAIKQLLVIDAKPKRKIGF